MLQNLTESIQDTNQNSEKKCYDICKKKGEEKVKNDELLTCLYAECIINRIFVLYVVGSGIRRLRTPSKDQI